MPRKKEIVLEKDKKEDSERKFQYKLNSLKTDFDAGKIKNFEQIFALIGPSVWSRLMHMGYDTFLNKTKNPGNFTNNELVLFAEIVNIDINVVIAFIFNIMKFKNKFKDGHPIRL